ncbi:hypothetical protein DVK05_13005 [Halorubrum sp. Atlit-8R]|uniref:hypothetical protein n=1 Tax=unclassified Halorubrum TaxID=2642239 RepID=UPI000EF22809|nr:MULTISPECIES: hypothetical protein [unclassified Halorubrum]RLM63826.1 hypothetical protein DVK08_14750 [Halorubrum sp. Atlit-9R]RLM77204.1 hypothetical protein DVK05_13005 [Halorubrum sp. Atlit-8R]
MLATPIGLYELSDVHLDVDEFGINIDDPVVLIGTRSAGPTRRERGTKTVVELGPARYPASIFQRDCCDVLDASNDILYGSVVVSADDLSDDAITALRESGGSVFSDITSPNALY